jgi:hypothetical protein
MAKRILGPICNFWKVAMAIFGIIFRFWCSVIEIMDSDLSSNKDRGLFAKLD